MNTILPCQNELCPHVTSPFGSSNTRPKPHGGVDFNYVGGQTGINLRNPNVNSPISGVVTFVGGKYGTIKIQDDKGVSHEILHTESQSVRKGENIIVGQKIGTMGNTGPGIKDHHVHYQIKENGVPVDPQAWWNKQSQ
ncbi:unnamed protein product [Rotaria sp. Silwood1]|nr:unnamed protein product [Rotaria sp. Silwood1]